VRVKKVQKKTISSHENGLARFNQEIAGILLFAAGVMTLLSLYINNSIGIFGRIIRELLIGFMGLPAFFIPIIIIVYSLFYILRRDDSIFRVRVFYTLVLMLLISSLIQTANYNAVDYENLTPVSSMIKFYNDVQANILSGGGLLGGLISTPFLLFLQVLGTTILLSTLTLIDIILLTNISIVNFFRNLKGVFTKSDKALRQTNSEKMTNELSLTGDGENLFLDFKPERKVIDFKIERTSRELRERAGNDQLTEGSRDQAGPIEFIMKDPNSNSSFKARKKTKTIADGNAIAEEIWQHDSLISEYRYPYLDLLNENRADDMDIKAFKNIAIEGAKKLEDTLKSFGVEAKVVNISRGPAVTRYELQPSPGVKVSKIVGLADDISLNLASSGVRIEAPIPGKAAIGIEVPNKDVVPVFLKEVIESSIFEKYPSKIAFAVGKDISGECVVADIAKMPHLLIAGATGAGKSVCINSLIISILFKASPDEVKLLMVDPKVVELGIYNGIPHLLIPVVTEPKKAAGALNWAVQEMIKRYKLFAEIGVRDLKGYNNSLKESEGKEPLPQIVIIIDELADLMMVAPNDVEDAICRLAQMARAAGMHLVIATQRPSVDVITGIIKANIPSRISFAVSSQVDSRTILDIGGAEKLLGKGDMLFYPVGVSKPIRVKGTFVSEKEVERVVEYIKSMGSADYDEDIIEEINSEFEPPVSNKSNEYDELLNKSIELVVESGQASVSLIQRRFKVGYARAARIVDQMEERGIVGGFEGSKPRQVLISKQQLMEMQMSDNN